MSLSKGDRLPEAILSRWGEKGPETVALSDLLAGRKVVVFALPGAFTGTCSTAHLPSFIRTAEAFRDKGVQDILCISVNDPFVLHAWDEATGASKGGVALLGDPDASMTQALGMAFTAPHIGLVNRSNRWAAVVEDGVVVALNVDQPGVCDRSTGEALLEQI